MGAPRACRYRRPPDSRNRLVTAAWYVWGVEDRNIIRLPGVRRTFHRYQVLFVLLLPWRCR